MASLTAYRGLQVVTPDPTGNGGLAIQRDFKSLVDWNPKSVWEQTIDPTANDDETDDFYPGSLWMRTDVPKLFVCVSSSSGAAVWRPILLQVVQDTAPKLGADLDVNGKKLISASNGDIVVQPNGTGKTGVGTTNPNSVLGVGGPISTALTTVTAAYTVTDTDSVVLCDPTGGAFTVTLPSAASIAGRQYTIKRVSTSSTVTVAAASGQTIEGSATFALSVGFAGIKVVSDGSNWWIV